MAVNGGGFACGATQVFFGATQVPAAQVLSVDCSVILLGTRPAAGQQVTVRTASESFRPSARTTSSAAALVSSSRTCRERATGAA